MIPAQHFRSHALETSLDLGRRFDLVISLEVAEHLPENAADTFVDSLVQHGDVILFSATIPFQGGHGHINEQWPGYWAEKFLGHGYRATDVLRPMIWGDETVFWWLRQNTLLFLSEDALSRHPSFAGDIVEDFNGLAMVHPALYLRWANAANR